jgi:hypothetical protein
MNKDELSDRFDNEAINILVQGYKHGGAEQQHPHLERENSFGKPNKTIDEAFDYQQKCEAEGLNRFIVVYEKPTNSRVPVTLRETLKINLMNIIYDYMKDYLGIRNDVSGQHISTSPDEEKEDYTFETLARNIEGIHKIVIHVSKDMEIKENGDFYRYLIETSIKYDNIRFLVLDQKQRGIEKMLNFEVMRWE